MANEGHLKILNQGAQAWNQWREENQEMLVYFGGVKLHGIKLPGMDLGGVQLDEVDLYNSDFSGANLKKASFYRAHLLQANFSRANLEEAHFYRADLQAANLRETNLVGADLSCTNLSEADLYGANLTGANLGVANFNGAKLHSTNFTKSVMGWSTLGDVDLTSVTGLETIRHLGPSTIGIDTIYRSIGNISCENFLCDAGVPVHLIDYIKKMRVPTDCFYTPERIDNWINKSKRQMVIYKDNTHIVQERMAQKGAFKDVRDVNELKEYENKIEEIKVEITELLKHQQKGCPVCSAKF